VKSRDGVDGSSTSSFQNLLAMLNTASGPLKDERVRKAVALSMDYEGLLSALKGAGVKSTGIIPEGLIGHDPSLEQTQDLEEAERLLGDAGFGPDGKALKLELTYAEGDDDQALASSLLKSALADLNVELQVRPLQWTAQWDKAKSKDPSRRQDILVFYWYPDYADPFSWFVNLFHSADEPYFNLSYYDNPELDKQIDGLQELTATDREQADEAYKEVQRTVIEDAVAMPLYVQTYLRGHRDSFDGYVDNPAYANVVFAYELEPTG
jgi:peptide/nickel transport system substrate-binding protein